jgi:hypothetical protein
MIKPEKDVVVLWKSQNVKIDNYFMFVIYYYYTDRDDKSNNFYKCNFRIDTKENWLKLKDDIIKTNPAEYFKTSMIGINDDYRIFYTNRIYNRIDMSKWIGSRFLPSKIISLNDFKHKIENTQEPFIQKYIINNKEVDITNLNDIDNIPKGLWFSAYREKKPRKKYGNLIF